MTSASVKNAGLDATLLPVTAKTVSAQRTQDGQDFGTIMNQTKGKAQQSNTPDAGQKQTQGVKTDKAKTKTANTEQSVKEDKADSTLNNVQDATKASQETPKEDNPVSEDVVDAVEEATQKIMNSVEEELDISEEELVAIMEQLGLQPIDLLQSQNLTELIAAVNDADSLIDVAVDADMYQQLQNLTEAVDTTLEDLMAQCGISEEELQSALEQLKMQAEQNAVQGEASQPDNIIPFEKNMDMAEAPMQPVAEDPIPVIKDRTQAPAQNQNPDANVTEVSQMTEHTEKDSSADEQETDSYQEGQENFNKFQNPAEETTVTPEQDVVPTRTVDTESIMKQLADYVKVRQGSELTEMEMQLHPASLGNVHIQLATKGGVVTAQITTQNEAVKNAIESQVVQLKDNLEEQGVKVEAVEVSVASHEMEKNLDQSGQQQQNEQQNNATGSIQRIRRANINLNLYNSEEEALEEASGLDDAARIAMEMMAANGNTMDLLA